MSTSVGGLFEAARKRRVFFSFHYDDVMRVNNVRKAWNITHPSSSSMRSFYDSSLWESKKLEGPEAVKSLIRSGVRNTSAVCVLIGTDTWRRRWVRYEMARAIIDGRGLLGVHINGLAHHQRRVSDPLGRNPLDYLGVSKVQEGALSKPRYYLCEGGNGNWSWYGDYEKAIDLPPWLAEPQVGYVTPLSSGAQLKNYVLSRGHVNIGAWIDVAARAAGR